MLKHLSLKDFSKRGVSLIIQFTNVYKPFAVIIHNDNGKVLYYRIFNKDRLELNLPVHGEEIMVEVLGDPKIKDILIADMVKPVVAYNFNTDRVQTRDYEIKDIEVIDSPIIENGSPARFFPYHGIMEINLMAMNQLPQPVDYFVRSHELGHYFYGAPIPAPEILKTLPVIIQQYFNDELIKDEIEADRFALYQLVNEGYNFSGFLNSLVHYLGPSEMSAQRMIAMDNEINKIHQQLAS